MLFNINQVMEGLIAASLVLESAKALPSNEN